MDDGMKRATIECIRFMLRMPDLFLEEAGILLGDRSRARRRSCRRAAASLMLGRLAQNGNVAGLQWMLRNIDDLRINASPFPCETPLILACQNDEDECARLLLAAGAAVDGQATGTGWTALMEACAHGSVECVRLLLTFRADAQMRDADGVTALHTACQWGHADCLSLLLEALRDELHATDARDLEGKTPLMVACAFGHDDCARLLVASGQLRTVDACIHAASSPFLEEHGRTALHYAALNGHAACVCVLLGAEAIDDVACEQGGTPLAIAASRGFVECVSALSGRASPRMLEDALRRAAVHGHVETSIVLLRAGARWTKAHGALVEGGAMPVIRLACEPWSPANHYLFPAPHRRRAWELLKIGVQLSRLGPEWQPLLDAWLDHLMPCAIRREV